MSSTPSSTMPPPDVPTSQGEHRVRPVQKLLLIILITAWIVLVGGVALLYYLSKSKDAGTQVASKLLHLLVASTAALRLGCVLSPLSFRRRGARFMPVRPRRLQVWSSLWGGTPPTGPHFQLHSSNPRLSVISAFTVSGQLIPMSTDTDTDTK